MLQLNVVGTTATPGTTATGERLLLLVHGYGADEHDLAPLAPYLDPEGAFFTVCPRGPLTVEPFGGASWYDFTDDGADEATFEGSLIELDHTVDAICEAQGLDRSRSVWVGFSQGGSMVLALALRSSGKARPAAVACLSGFLHERDWLVYDWAATDLPPIYVQHGTYDPMLPVERGRKAAERLRQEGLTVTFNEYPMQHEIRPESIADIRAFLGSV
jgi:phospholipase/carboxylesterase